MSSRSKDECAIVGSKWLVVSVQRYGVGRRFLNGDRELKFPSLLAQGLLNGVQVVLDNLFVLR